MIVKHTCQPLKVKTQVMSDLHWTKKKQVIAHDLNCTNQNSDFFKSKRYPIRTSDLFLQSKRYPIRTSDLFLHSRRCPIRTSDLFLHSRRCPITTSDWSWRSIVCVHDILQCIYNVFHYFNTGTLIKIVLNKIIRKLYILRLSFFFII